MGRTEYLYRLYALREKKKLLDQFVFTQVLKIEKHAESLRDAKREGLVAQDITEILEICESIRAFSEELT